MVVVICILGILVLAMTGFAILQSIKTSRIKMEVTSYQNVFKHTNDALMLIDILDGKILYANTGTENLLGYPLETLYAKTIFDLHAKDQLAKSSEIIARVYEEKGLIYTDMPFISAKGEEIAVECSARVEDFGGKPVIFISARDIRERLKLQGQIRTQNAIIEQKNKDLIDSITYSKNIQHAILPSLSSMKRAFGEMFVLYIPKDIVSGDFYWYASVKTNVATEHVKLNSNIDIIAAVDCTGHGVPGAFMSLLGYTLLNQSVKVPEVNTPALVIEYMHNELINTLNKKKEEAVINDGMDMSVCAIDRENMKLLYAAANHEMFHFRNGVLNVVKGDKQAIGVQSIDTFKPYTNNEVDLQKGDTIYLFSDGFEDQFGGEKGKKYRSAHLKEFILSIQSKNMEEQREALHKEYMDWKGKQEQVDDVLIIGIRI